MDPKDRAEEAPRWMSQVLWLAAVYNILWGGWVVLAPLALFQWLHLAPPNYPPLWQCLGMVVGVYGVGYACAACAPLRHWPIVLVGLLGKLCGPFGFLIAGLRGELPWRFGMVLLANDLIWWIPFALILYRAAKQVGRGQEYGQQAVNDLTAGGKPSEEG